MNALQTPYRVTFGDSPSKPGITLLAGRHFRLYPLGVRGDVSKRLSARMVDLLRLSLGVIVVDGLLRRDAASAGLRNPHIEVEVLDPAFWCGEEVARTLKTSLDFLSGDDDWHVRFVPDRTACHHYQDEFAFTGPTTVCLYSGGLDSAAGLAARLREQPDRTYIPLIVRHQFLRGSLVKRQFDLLKRRYPVAPSQFLPLIIAAFVRNCRLYRDFGIRTRETSHRCRSFLFTALASVVAAVEGSDRMEIYESGIGAVNLPLTSGMSGWRTTRSTHPHFLRTMSRLVSLVVGRTITLELPFIDQTKASMVGVLAKDGLNELALTTVSCILHPLRRGNIKQCGFCPACVFRRYALQLAEIPEPRQSYHYDLFGSPAAFNRVPKKRLHALRAFLWQAERLAELDSAGSVPTFFRNHLLGTKVILDDTALAPFVELFRRYRREWLEIAARGQTRQWLWADWLAPRKVAV
jgi:7-cyano-7-deazaguanine synthase in queuosine biosynthesis